MNAFDNEPIYTSWEYDGRLAEKVMAQLEATGNPFEIYQNRVGAWEIISKDIPEGHELYATPFWDGDQTISFMMDQVEGEVIECGPDWDRADSFPYREDIDEQARVYIDNLKAELERIKKDGTKAKGGKP